MTASPRDRLHAKITSQPTGMLATIAVQLYAKEPPEVTAEESLVRGMVADAIVDRYPAVDAQMDQWFSDESPAGLAFINAHTYGELLALAVDVTGVTR
jgi:hypothetical protein